MDSLWQQHRTFIVRILAGLGVILVCWIVGSSLTEESLGDITARNASSHRAISNKLVPSDGDIASYGGAVETLREQVRFTSAQVAEMRQGEELRMGLIADILGRIDRDTPQNRSRYEGLARRSPKSCVVGLRGDAQEYLDSRAGLSNVLIDSELGMDRITFDESEADRYLLTLDLIVRTVSLAIEERVYEVKSINIGSPSGGKFEGGDIFLRQYPISLTVRGRSASVISFLERLSDPETFIPVKNLTRFGHDRGDRDADVMTATLDVMAIVVNPDAELGE